MNRLGLFNITNAAITPGTHPQRVKRKTINREPQPLSITTRGGNKMDNKTLKKLIIKFNLKDIKFDSLDFYSLLIFTSNKILWQSFPNKKLFAGKN